MQTQLNTLLSGNASTAINSFNEIIAFLANVQDSQTLSGIIAGINTSIANHTHNDATTSASGLMSSTDKAKLNNIAEGAEVNVQPDWNQTTTTAKDFIKNKPTIPTVTNDFTNEYKAAIDRETDYNAVTTLVSLPVTKRIVLANVSAATSLSLANTLVNGKELLIKLVNNTASAITQPLPTSAPFSSTKNDGTAISSITLPASGKVEISIIAINSVYYIKTDA